MKLIEIEATNRCNATCLMCPRQAMTRPRGDMSWSTFQTVADKVLTEGQTTTFSFSGLGEPLLNPLVARFVGYVSPHVETFLTTNGSLLDDGTLDALLQANLNHLILSFNGFDAESYEHIMRPLRFERIEAAIRRLVLASGSHAAGATRLTVTASVTVSNLTKHDVAATRAFLASMGVERVSFWPCHSRGGALRDHSICSLPPFPATDRCDIFAATTFVAWNGQVLACCQDVAGAAVLGDLATMPVQELAMRRARILEEGVRFPMCPACNDMQRLTADSPPRGASLSEWIYRLYESEDSRLAALTDGLRMADSELAGARDRLASLEVENARLRELVAGYERGRFIRFMRWLRRRRRSLRVQ